MTELRTTRPSINRFLNGFGLGCVLVLGLGCGRQSREAIDAAENGANATDRPLMSRLPPPRCEWIDYSPKDLKLGIMESGDHKVGNPAERLMLYCYHYDPSTGKYGFAILNVMRLAGIATLLGLGTMAFVFWRRNKKKELVVKG